MCSALATLLLFQLLGEMIQNVTRMPIPGPLIGMVLMFTALLVKAPLPSEIHTTSRTLLAYLALLFVPAGTGIVTRLPLVAAEWLPILIGVLASTFITIAVTALVLRALERLNEVRELGPDYGQDPGVAEKSE
jgi:holin-like protein